MPHFKITYKYGGATKQTIVEGKDIGSARRAFMRRHGTIGNYDPMLSDVGIRKEDPKPGRCTARDRQGHQCLRTPHDSSTTPHKFE